MKITPGTTIAELSKEYPNGFAIGPGSAENPGAPSSIVLASPYLRYVIERSPLEANQGYLIVEMINI